MEEFQIENFQLTIANMNGNKERLVHSGYAMPKKFQIKTVKMILLVGKKQGEKDIFQKDIDQHKRSESSQKTRNLN